MTEPEHEPEPPSAPRRSDEDVAADVFDFQQAFFDDEDGGGVQPLSHYLRRFPGAEEAIAAEYLILTGEVVAREGAPAGSGAGSGDGDAQQFGKYVLEKRLGRGGQGEVWLARDVVLDRRVALKVLSALFVTEEQRRRFRREAESIARLEHPGVAQVFDADVDGSPPFIAMRHVEGVDLGRSLASAKGDGGVPPLVPWVPGRRRDVVPVLRFFERCARALHAAHEAGVVHRDVKPGNIMVTPDGAPVLLDFGLAHARSADDGAALTREGDVFGTLAYMAPEQLRGDAADVSPRTDVFALGVTLFEALTGERPFAGASPAEVAIAIDAGKRADARTLNPVLGEDVAIVLDTALEASLERRYPTALELAEDLRRIAEYEPIRARRAGPWLRFRRWCRREPAAAAALGVTLASVVLYLVLSQLALKRMRTLLGEKVAQQALAHVPELNADAPAGAVAFVLAAVELEDDWSARSALVAPLFDLNLERRYTISEGKRPLAAAFEGDGSTFVLGGPGPRVARYRPGDDAQSGEVLARAVEADVRCVAVEPGLEDAQVVVGSSDGRVFVLRARDLSIEYERRVGEGPLFDLIVRDGVAVAVTEAVVLAFDVATGEVRGRFEPPAGAGLATVVAPRSSPQRFVVGPRAFRGPRARGESVWILEGPGLTPTVELAHGARVQALCAARDAALAATVDAAGGVRAIDVETGTFVSMGGAERRAPAGELAGMAIALDPSGTRVAVGFDVAGARWALQSAGAAQDDRWEPSAEEEAASLFLLDLPAGGVRAIDAGPRVTDLTFDPSGRHVAAAGWSKRVGVWDASSGDLVREHRDWNRPDTLRFAPDGRRLLSIGIASSVEVWRARPLPEAVRFARLGKDAAEVTFCAFVPGTTGRRVVLADTRGRAGLFAAPRSGDATDEIAGALLRRLDGLAAAAEPAWGRVTLAASTPRVAWLGPGGGFTVVDVDAEGPPLEPSVGSFPAFRGRGRDFALARDGRALAAVDRDGKCFVARLDEDGAVTDVRTLDGDAPVELARFAVDGSALFLAFSDGRVVRRSLTDPSDVCDFEAPEGEVVQRILDLAVAPDGSEVAVACNRGDLIGWEPATGKVVRSGGRPTRRRFLAFGPDGTLGSAGFGPGSLQMFRDGELPPPEQVIEGEPYHVAIDGEGRLAALAEGDGTVLVWDLATGEPRLAPRVHRGAARCVAIDGVGRDARVLSAGADGAALWVVDVLPLARRIAPRRANAFERSFLSDAEAHFR